MHHSLNLYKITFICVLSGVFSISSLVKILMMSFVAFSQLFCKHTFFPTYIINRNLITWWPEMIFFCIILTYNTHSLHSYFVKYNVLV